MNKEQLISKIEAIPNFILRDVAVKDFVKLRQQADTEQVSYEDKEVDEWVEQEHWRAVTEEGNTIPLAFVWKRYQLVQFKDVFLPLIKNIPELHGNLLYYGGMGLLDVFPLEERLKEGNDRIGLVALNSVNKTSSVIIKFCVQHNGVKITIPKKLAGFKRMHVGKTIQITQNFLEVVDKVRRIWKTIITEFTKIKITETYATTVLDEVGIKDQHIRKKLMKKIMMTADMDLWDMFLHIIGIIEERNYKSDLHKRKRLDRISDAMFKWAITCKLLNA